MNKILKLMSKKAIFFFWVTFMLVFSTYVVNANGYEYEQKGNIVNQSISIKDQGSLGGVQSQNAEVNSTFSKTAYSSGALSGAENYVNSKLGDVVGFFQSTIRPFTYVTFILSAITLIVGIITGSRHKFAGIVGMCVSIIVCVLVTYAPTVVEYLGAWLSM